MTEGGGGQGKDLRPHGRLGFDVGPILRLAEKDMEG